MGVVGQGIDRVDGRSKVRGEAKYSAEVPVAGVAHGVIVVSTVARGRVASLDTAEVERASGIVAVLTPENAPKLHKASEKGHSPLDRVLSVLQDSSVAYNGQPIALVVAETLDQARWGAEHVKATYSEETPTVVLDETTPTEEPKPSPVSPKFEPRGEFDEAYASAVVRVDATYRTPRENHNPMEMHSTTAVWRGHDEVTLYDSTQSLFGVRKRIAQLFELDPSKVRVICRYVGGGFGCKGAMWSHVALATLAAKAIGRPVRVTLTRPQMFTLCGYRPDTLQRVSLGAAADGKLVAIRHETTSQSSRFDDFVEPSSRQTRMLYACPNVSTSQRLARLDVATPTFMRAPGESSGTFALESAMDELAVALGMDPIALRLVNYADVDPDEGKPWSSKSLKECYARGADRFGWSRRDPRPRSMRDGRVLVGMGMATATYPARQDTASALARLNPDGTALVLAGSQDLGTGTYTVMTQIAADALGLPVDHVHFDLGDTSMPETPGSGGSRTAATVGPAVKKACESVLRKLVLLAVADPASPLHGLAADAIEARDGKLVARADARRFETHAAVLARHGGDGLEERATTDPADSRKHRSCHAFGAQFVEVSVDPDLGEVRVRRAVGAFAAGRILNAKTARSQFLGGIVYGLGMALEEKTVIDPRSGLIVTKDLADYHVPVNADVPAIDVIMVEEEDPYVNPLGVKGIGEIGITGVAAAVANAVFHATGRRVRDLPVTLDKLL